MFYSFYVFIYWFPPWMNLSFQETETLWFLCYKDNLTVTNVYLRMAMDLSGKTMFPQAHVCVPQFLQLELYKIHCISKKRGTHIGRAGRRLMSSFNYILSALLLIALPFICNTHLLLAVSQTSKGNMIFCGHFEPIIFSKSMSH